MLSILANTPATGNTDVYTQITSFIAPILIVILGVIIINFIAQRRFSHALAFTMISGGVALLFYAPGIVRDFGKNIAGKSPENATPAPSEAPATPPPAESTDAVKMPWEVLGFVGLAIVLLAVAVIACTVFYKKYSSSTLNRKENTSGWDKLVAHHNAIRVAWNSYEMDMGKVIDFPFMNDMREPAVVALHQALRKASQLEPSSVKVVAHLPFADSPFAKAVQDLQVAFDAAESEAKRVSWSKFSPDERKRLATAKGLLALAMDKGASASERQIAYKRVIKELEGIVHVPEKAVLELEASSPKELEAV